MSIRMCVMVLAVAFGLSGCYMHKWAVDFDSPPEFREDPIHPHLSWWTHADEVFLGLSCGTNAGLMPVGTLSVFLGKERECRDGIKACALADKHSIHVSR